MLIQSQAGALPAARQTSGTPNNPGGTFGEGLFTELAPQYYTLAKSGKVFTLGASGVTTSAFTGGAAGTPLLGLYNPVASGVDLVLLWARVGIRTTGTAAANLDFNFWGVNQGGVAVTGTQTAARNVYSLAATGAQGYGMVNTANTAALASALLAPSVSLGAVGATAAPTPGRFVDGLHGALIVAPGCYLAFGASAALTAGSVDAALVWAELPA